MMMGVAGVAFGASVPSDYQSKMIEEGYVYTTPWGFEVKEQVTEKFRKQTIRTRGDEDEEETLLTINIVPPSNGDSYSGVFAFAFNTEDPEIFDIAFFNNQMSAYEFWDLPEGEYDVICWRSKGTDDPFAASVIAAMIAHAAPNSGEITLATDDCIYETKWEPELPDGTKFLDVDAPGGGNSGALSNTFFVAYNGSPFLMTSSGTRSCSSFVLKTNIENTGFSVLNHGAYLGDYGIAVLQADLKLCNQTVIPSVDRWKTCDPVTFMPTPFNKRYNEIEDSEGDFPNAALTTCFVFHHDGSAQNSMLSSGIVVPEGKIMVWEQPGLTLASAFPQPASCSIGRLEKACISGQFLNYTEEGLIPVGQNLAYGLDYVFKDGNRTLENMLNGNPRYSGLKYTNIILGNCAPVLVLAPIASETGTGFNFSYVGNYGECMNINSYNQEANFGQEWVEKYGGPVCDFKLSLDGQEVCSTYGEVANYNWVKGDYEAEISTRNVNIDNELSGYNKAVVKYPKNVSFGTLPTVTALQFRDAEDEITNRYNVSEGAFAEIFAGCFKRKMSESYNNYYSYSPLKSVKFEYAPTGNDSWTELGVTTEHDLFWTTYGECYRVDLSGISRRSSNGWFDVRVTVTSPDGASTEQTISPAFKVEALNGINGVADDSKEIFVEGRTIIAPAAATIYTIDGTKVNSRNVIPGIYIVKNGDQTVKMVVR